MTRVDPLVNGVLSDLARGLRALNVDFCVIGALVPELLPDTPPRRMNSRKTPLNSGNTRLVNLFSIPEDIEQFAHPVA
jgi:hypothetical protein